MNLFKRIKLHLLWHREAARIRNELSTYSPRELQQDLGINPSDIGDVAARGADAFVASYVRAHPDYRQAFYGFGNAADLPA